MERITKQRSKQTQTNTYTHKNKHNNNNNTRKQQRGWAGGRRSATQRDVPVPHCAPCAPHAGFCPSVVTQSPVAPATEDSTLIAAGKTTARTEVGDTAGEGDKMVYEADAEALEEPCARARGGQATPQGSNSTWREREKKRTELLFGKVHFPRIQSARRRAHRRACRHACRYARRHARTLLSQLTATTVTVAPNAPESAVEAPALPEPQVVPTPEHEGTAPAPSAQQ